MSTHTFKVVHSLFNPDPLENKNMYKLILIALHTHIAQRILNDSELKVWVWWISIQNTYPTLLDIVTLIIIFVILADAVYTETVPINQPEVKCINALFSGTIMIVHELSLVGFEPTTFQLTLPVHSQCIVNAFQPMLHCEL